MNKLSQVLGATVAFMGMGSETKRVESDIDEALKRELNNPKSYDTPTAYTRPSPVYVGVRLPDKQWKKRKVSNRIAKNSRKANRR